MTTAARETIDLSGLTPAQIAELDELLGPDPTGVLTFREFIARVAPRYRFYRWCEKLIDVLQRVADREIDRLIVCAPPRHGKSETLSRLFTAYWLYRYPDQFVGLVSYAATLARTLSKAARTNYQTFRGERPDDATTAVEHWETGHGGGMWAAGVGGSITGKGAHLAVIDDPVKSAKDASSEALGIAFREWYPSTFYSRLEPGAALVIMATRWPGHGDVIGWLLEQERETAEPERWHIITFEAIKEDSPAFVRQADVPADTLVPDNAVLPESCTMERDDRAVGEPLCPERYPLPKLRRIQQLNPFYFASLYQQRPRPREGIMFPPGSVEIVNTIPAGARRVRYWDKAGTEKNGAYTAGVLMAEKDGIYYVEDVIREQLGSERRRAKMREAAELDGVDVQVYVEQEPGSGGKESAENDIKLFAGFAITTERVTGDKVRRAQPFADQWQAGNVKIKRAPWTREFIAEAEAFPHGKYKDQIDAAAGAFNKLALGPALLVA